MIGLGEIITTCGMMKSENGINCGFSLSFNDTVKPRKLLWLSLHSFPHLAMLFTFWTTFPDIIHSKSAN